MNALLTMLLFFAVSLGTPKIQEVETLTADFVEYADDTYFFIDKEDYSHEFQGIKKEVLDTYNLRDDTFKGKSFEITCETDTEEDEDGDNILISIITALKLAE